MSIEDNGGPAFPESDVMALDPRNTAEMVSLAHGMTLRDYFAAKAMQGMLCNGFVPSLSQDANRPHYNYAKHAYAIADAMLEARKQ
jgi:hypothetical protein